MGKEIDLLINYPKSKRNLDDRASNKTDEQRDIARKFGKDFFDGIREVGYGGYNYNSRFWTPVVPTFVNHWDLNQNSSILDVGCGKGFMLYDFKQAIPGLTISGIDISEYAIENSKIEVKDFLRVADCRSLPYEDNSFDYIISINTIHNVNEEECFTSLKEIERVSKKGSFVTVDAYRNDIEKERMYKWNLTAKTIKSVDDWVNFFNKSGYTGDYFWFIP